MNFFLSILIAVFGLFVLILSSDKPFNWKKTTSLILGIIICISGIILSFNSFNSEVKKKNENLLRREIIRLSNNAKNDSKSSYLRLKKMSKRKDDIGLYALERLTEIENGLEMFRIIPSFSEGLNLTKNDGTKIPFENLSTVRIIHEMDKPNCPKKIKQICIRYIKKRDKEEIYSNSINVLKNSESLSTCAAFCGMLIEITKNKNEFLDFDGWIKICEDELQKIKSINK